MIVKLAAVELANSAAVDAAQRAFGPRVAIGGYNAAEGDDVRGLVRRRSVPMCSSPGPSFRGTLMSGSGPKMRLCTSSNDLIE